MGDPAGLLEALQRAGRRDLGHCMSLIVVPDADQPTSRCVGKEVALARWVRSRCELREEDVIVAGRRQRPLPEVDRSVETAEHDGCADGVGRDVVGVIRLRSAE